MASGTPVFVSYDGEGNPVARSPQRAELRRGASTSLKEHVLQAIVDQHPDVLPWKEFFPSASAVCSLGREIPVDLGERVGERQGYIDNLLVTDDGHLVLVETKLWRNPEAVRQVIAQVMEYAMAIGDLGLEALEQAIRQSDPKGRRLVAGESIAKRMQTTAASLGSTESIDDFEDALARFRQTGELLVLIVADGVKTSVERLTKWFGDQLAPGSPIRLGLVELRFYENEGGHLVVPVTLLRTKELGRHTVVVEVREGAASRVAVSVRDVEAGRTPTTRQVSGPDAAMTKELFLVRARQLLSGDQLGTVEALVVGLDGLPLTTRGTPTTWQYGVKDGAAFLGLVMLGDRYLWCQIPARLRAVLADERFVQCKRILNRVAPFYRPEDVEDPSKVNALTPKYDVVVGREQEFIGAIGSIAALVNKALDEQP